MCSNKIRPLQAYTAICSNTNQANSWEESAKYLLDALIIDDDHIGETVDQILLRTANYQIRDIEDPPPFTEEEVTELLHTLRKGKAPGLGGIDTYMIQGSWPELGTIFTDLANACLSTGTFPQRWKHGKIIAILKSKDRNDSEPSSYRPICLLPVLGKLLEKLIKQRIEPLTTDMFAYQYGFRKGISTTDVIIRLKNLVSGTSEKYAFGIFADIKGAFDRVWWPDVRSKLRDVRCPPNLYGLIESYLSDRKVTIIDNTEHLTKVQNRGCPQGSVLGPIFWNLVFDSLLDELSNLGNCSPNAYADDLVLLIRGNTRKQLETYAQGALQVLDRWCRDHKMLLSTDKTVGPMLKGRLDDERPPILRMASGPLKFCKTVKYLGIMIDKQFRFTSHTKYVAEKAKIIMYKYAAMCGLKWGVSYREMLTIYRGSFVPIINYAAYAWIDNVNSVSLRKIISAHRCALIRVTKAYRTTSTHALEVISNVAPIAHELQLEKLRYCIRKAIPCNIYGTIYETRDQNPKNLIENVKADLKII